MKQCFLTTNGPKAIGPYSTAVTCGRTVYLSGMIPADPATGKIVEGGVEAQAQQVFENIRTVLGEMGLSFANALKATVFLTDLGTLARSTPFMSAISAPHTPPAAAWRSPACLLARAWKWSWSAKKQKGSQRAGYGCLRAGSLWAPHTRAKEC